MISRTLKERAIKKYHDSIDVSRHEESSIKKTQDLEFQQRFESKRRSSTISYQHQINEAKKYGSVELSNDDDNLLLNSVKKNLLETIEHD